MCRNYWLLVFGAIGWLTLSRPLLAQSPSSEGVPSEAPSVEKNHQGQTSTGENSSLNFSLPVRIIENPEQAKRANETEKESRKHDQSDLEAQWKAADSAFDSAKYSKELLTISWWQFWLASAGTIALIYSIMLNRRATGAAITANSNTIKAIQQEQENAQRGLQAYLCASNARFITPTVSAPIEFEIKISNSGQTPAKNIAVNMEIWATRKNSPDIEIVSKAKRIDRMGYMAPGLNGTFKIKPARTLNAVEMTEFSQGDIVFWATGRVDYVDAFEKNRWITFGEKYCKTIIENTISADNTMIDGDYDGN
jgi:hypothetical protein